MYRLIMCALFCVTLTACKSDESRQVVQATSPDGHVFHFMPIYEDGVTDITITMAWADRWAFDAARNPAVPYLAADVMRTGGTAALPPQEVMEIFNDKNSSATIRVSPDIVYGEVSFPKEHVDQVIGITSELLSRPVWAPTWMERMQNGLYDNLAQRASHPSTQMGQAVRYAILGDTALNTFIGINDIDAVMAVTRDELIAWHGQTFTNTPMAIAVTGAISAKDAGRAIDDLLSGLPTGSVDPLPTIDTNYRARKILLHLPEAEKTTLGLYGALPQTKEGKELHDLLALNFFARGGQGPLFDAVRTQARASYGLSAGYANFARDQRFMFIGGEVETGKLAQVSDLILTTYDRYRTAPNLDGFDDFRSTMADHFAQNLSYVDIAAQSILQYALDGIDPAGTPTIGDEIRNIMAKDVSEHMATTFPDVQNITVIAVSPDATALPGACVVTRAIDVLTCN